MLQSSSTIAKPEHSLPLWDALIFVSLAFVLFPPPQVFEHSLISQSVHSQLTIDNNCLNITKQLQKRQKTNLNVKQNNLFFLTWAFLKVAFFQNNGGAQTFFPSISGFYFLSSCNISDAYTTWFWAWANFPIIPHAINYTKQTSYIIIPSSKYLTVVLTFSIN